MKINFITLLMLVGILLTSCNNELDEVQIEASDTVDNQGVTGQSDSILSFDSETAFREAVEKVRSSKLLVSPKVRSVTSKDETELYFESIFDEYEQAMEEADDYYLREGGYEEFKQKFSNLYYPEYQDDYSAYLPVSDEAVAKLLNKEGMVIIAGEIIDMRDVFSYGKLQELGLAIPDIDYTDENSLTTRSYSYVTLTESKQKINSKRKAWITYRGGIKNKNRTIARVDVCFRKKGWVGWYNGKITSNARLSYKQEFLFLETKYAEYSPHKYGVLDCDDEQLNILKNTTVSSAQFTVTFLNENGFIGVTQVDYNKLAKLQNGLGFIENWRNWEVTRFVWALLTS